MLCISNIMSWEFKKMSLPNALKLYLHYKLLYEHTVDIDEYYLFTVLNFVLKIQSSEFLLTLSKCSNCESFQKQVELEICYVFKQING